MTLSVSDEEKDTGRGSGPDVFNLNDATVVNSLI